MLLKIGNISVSIVFIYVSFLFSPLGQAAFSSDSPRQSDGSKLAMRATHTPLAEGDYVHSNTSDDNVWAFSYPEVESTRDPLLNTAPIAYEFNK